MDKWENVVEDFPLEPDIRVFNKMRQTAAVILGEDLAEFELRRYLKTLFLKPISLIATIESRRNEASWSTPIAEAFKLIGEIVEKYGNEECMENYYEDLSKLCVLKYDSSAQSDALKCLTSIVKKSEHGAVHHKQIISRLEQNCMPTGQGKAPLAVLVGSICEYYPALVKKHTMKIFRTYLRMMDLPKNTDTVNNAILKGLNGVFKHLDLPTAELMIFYTKISSSKFIMSKKYEEEILCLLENHAGLFKEKMAEDHQLRKHLWSILKAPGTRGERIAAALLSVYEALCDVVEDSVLENVIKSEVVSKIRTSRQVKYTALRIITYVETNKQIFFDVKDSVDMQGLEFEIRNESVSYDCADAIKWCIQSGLPNSNRLLRTVVLFYKNLPNKKMDVVVDGVLNSNEDLRQEIITLLILETCLNESNMEAYLPLWEMLFDTKQVKTLKKHSMLFEDFVLYLAFSVQLFMDEAKDEQEIPEKLSRMLKLTSHVLSYQKPCQYTVECSNLISDCCLQLLREFGTSVALVEVISELIRHCEDVPLELYEFLNIGRCCDEALLCAFCICLVQAPEDRVKPQDILVALEIIFSRNDDEPNMLIKSLKKLESYIKSNNENLDRKHLVKVINLIEKLRLRRDLIGKDARVLQRDVVMFLGKYSVSQSSDMNNNAMDNVHIVKLKIQNLLSLDVPNTKEGATVYKVHLENILEQALINEDSETLQSILTIICANLCKEKESCLQIALCRVLHALCRVHSRGFRVDMQALLSAAHLCATTQCARLLTNYISQERSPGVRRMLSDALESLLVEDPSSDTTLSLVNAVADEAIEMMESRDSSKRRAGLDITQSLIVALETSHSCIEKLLPSILVLISKTGQLESKTTFEIASKLFIEHIYLFDSDVLQKLAKELLEILFNSTKIDGFQLKIYKTTVKMCLELTKHICNNTADLKPFDLIINAAIHKDVNTLKVSELLKEDVHKLIYVLAVLNIVFVEEDFVNDLKDSEVMEKFFELDFNSFENNFEFESTFYFLMEYNGTLLDLKRQETLNCVASLIKRLKPSSVIYLHKILPKALLPFKGDSWPETLVESYQNWVSSLPIDDLTKSLMDLYVDKENIPILKSVRIMSDIFKIKLTALEFWPTVIFNDFQNKHLQVSQLSNMADALTAVKMTPTDVIDTLTDVELDLTEVEIVTKEEVFHFLKSFIGVFFEYFVSKPFLLLDVKLRQYCLFINDIVKYCNKRRCSEMYGAVILELVNEIWPFYMEKSDLGQKRELLQDLLSFHVKLDSNSPPMQWVKGVLRSYDTSLHDKAFLIGVLPGGMEYSMTYRRFASLLPARLSEMCSPFDGMFRALLDSLAANGDRTILDIVISLAKGDDTEGWWDSAYDSCAASLAMKRDISILKAVYRRCYEGTTTGVCKRLMLPLLRYSSSMLCEEFFSNIVKDLFDMTKRKQMVPTNSDAYLQYVMKGIKEFLILQMAFEKISSISLESPSSLLYKEIVNEQSWFIVRFVCKLCVTLRSKVTCPNEAREDIKEACRLLQCAAFNCIAAALCSRQHAPHWYDFAFDDKVWSSVVDDNLEYDLPLKSSWIPKTKRHAVAISVNDNNTSVSSTLSLTRTIRTRIFVDRLSEDPLHYDRFANEDEEKEMTTQDLQLLDNELNNHEISATLTALICHACSLESDKWLQTLIKAFKGNLSTNTKWICGQAVCNAKEGLKRYASELRPALLTLVTNTAIDLEDKKILNGFHLEVLDTICYWGEIDSNDEQTNIRKVIKYLIHTCMENANKEYIYKNLLGTLTKLMNIYKDCIQLKWRIFSDYFDDEDTCKKTIQILLKVTKYKIYVDNLLQNLLQKFNNKYTTYFSNLAEIFGLAMVSCSDDDIKKECLHAFLKILEKYQRSDSYIKLLYYAQLNCKECCDARNFRLIPSLVSQFPTAAYRKKCLDIISAYISKVTIADEDTWDLFASLDICQMIKDEDTIVEAIGVVKNGFQIMGKKPRTECVILLAGYCEHSLIKVRKAALEVVLKVFRDLFDQSSDNTPKRQKQEVTTLLKLLDTKDVYSRSVLTAVGLGCIDNDSDVAAIVKAGVAECLNTVDMNVRFAEAFFVVILSPLRFKDIKHKDLSVCMSAFLDVLFYDLRNEERFTAIKLREKPLFDLESVGSTSKLLTMSKTYQGTMKSRKILSKRVNKTNLTDPKQSGINVQVTIASILDKLMEFSKVNSETSKALCLEMMRILIAMKDLSFDLSHWMSKMLTVALKRDACSITPLIVEGARLIADDICKEDSIKEIVGKLKTSTICTEGQELCKILHEDVLLRTLGHEQFEMGKPILNMDFEMEEDNEFSLEDLVNTFGKLANWEQLTIQQKQTMKTSLPPIWTDRSTFRRWLEIYEERDSWFGKMCFAYKGESKQDTIRLLSVADKWPRRLFVTSAITETINWEENIIDENYASYPCNIKESDCLAEWAARLMIRTAHLMLTHSKDERAMMLSRSDELKWCVSANERDLSSLVLQCVKRNGGVLFEDETLAWLEQRVIALRNIALEENNVEKLRKALEISEQYTPNFLEHTSSGVILSMNNLILQLNCDLESLTQDKLTEVLKNIDRQTDKRTCLTEFEKQTLKSIYHQAVVHYSESTNEGTQTNVKIANMSEILKRVISQDLKENETFLALILDQFNNFKDLDEDSCRKLLDQVQYIIPSLDQLFIDILVNDKSLFSVASAKEYSVMVKLEREQKGLKTYKDYFQLINDAEHCLWMYCEDLMDCVRAGDAQKWTKTFNNMKKKIFENPFKGSDYQLLTKYKEALYKIEDYAKTDPPRKYKVLNDIKLALSNKKERKTIRLSQVCGRLVANKTISGDTSLTRLLGIRPGLDVIKFDEQVTVFTYSKRRPCSFRVILSNGESRKYLHKCGEPLRVDCAALSVQKACNSIWRVDQHVYNVTPLSDDCGLIEYLEEHVRVRDLITGIKNFNRPSDVELILTPVQELVRLHDQNCSKVPSYSLRSAIEKNSSNTQDFITKKNNYLNTLATMTVLNWVLGVGDRHLENIMYSNIDGGLVGIDWANIFIYGAGYEPAPARLTRNILAVCDITVLESYIQKLMIKLRKSHKILMPYINVSFQWMGDEFSTKKKYIESTLKGTLLSFEIAKEIIRNSKDIDYKEKYVEFYNIIFEKSEDGVHSIEKQVSTFLKHCTDKRILGVTRKGWEPWI